jgi:hypothetical protein
MPSLAHLCAGGFAVILLIDYMPGATWSNPGQQSFHAQVPRALHVVDRTHKGDRITSPEGSQSNVRPVPLEQPRPKPAPIPVGCDPAFSPLTGANRGNFAGRCLAENTPAPRVFAALQ